ncbi:MAG: tetratricopeptide repeat protein [Deltaproteobacteria bacterium]|nr:tetratricopeptide repeat protein [Deltaproteobacteria bacterium]
MRRRLLIVALAALLFPLGASAAGDPQLKRAQDRFQYGDYADAVQQVSRLLEQNRLTSDESLVEAHRILGLAYYYLDRKEEARSALVSLLSVDPDFKLDPFFYPPKVVEFFDQVKAENETLLAPIREQKARIEAERFRAEQARLRLLEEERKRREEAAERLQPSEVVERVEENHPYLLNWLPFGVGQFQNGDVLKGSLLAGGQTLAAGASVLGYLVTANLRTCKPLTIPGGSLGQPDQEGQRCGIPEGSQNLAATMISMKWIAGAAFWGLFAYGIIDAHLHWEPVVLRSQTTRKLPTAPPTEATSEPPSTSTDTSTGSPETPDAGPTPQARLHLAPWFGPKAAGATLVLTF